MARPLCTTSQTPELGDFRRYVAEMRILNSTVETAIEIKGRGCVLCPGLLKSQNPAVKIGEHLHLQGPDGTMIDTTVAGIEMIRSTERTGLPILLPREIHKIEIPVGTLVFVYEGSPCDCNPKQSGLEIGQSVRVILSHRNRTPHDGTIVNAIWHHKCCVWHYYIRDHHQRRVAKRYTAVDLEIQQNAT